MEESAYIEFLIEDQSGEILLDEIMKKYCAVQKHVIYRIHRFHGIGHIPKHGRIENRKTGKILADLPQYLRGFNKSMQMMPGKKAVFVIVDDDDKDCAIFKQALLHMAEEVPMSFATVFCIAVKEMEAWLLGDSNAIQTAYAAAKIQQLQGYIPDGEKSTWEFLAEIVYPGGLKRLRREDDAYYPIGRMKCEWASKIGSQLQLSKNNSPSFRYFMKKLDQICIT